MAKHDIEQLCAERGMTLRAVCKGAGIRYGTLHAQISHGRPIPFETYDRLCNYLCVPLQSLSAYRSTLSVDATSVDTVLHHRAAQAYTAALQKVQMEMMYEGYEIGTDQILDWLSKHENRLENFDAIRENVDLYFPVDPSDNMFHPYRVGKSSLATRCFGIKNEDHFIKVVSSFDQDLLDRVLVAHIEVERHRYMVSDETISVRIGDHSISPSYRRVIAPVFDKSGNRFTLVHSRLIHEK